MDWTTDELPPPPVLTPFHMDSVGPAMLMTAGTNIASTASITWPSANKAYFYPFRLTAPATVKQFLVSVGTASFGNLDVGIYDAGLRLVVSSGGVAVGSANAIQQINIADTDLLPGDYYLAMVVDNTTAAILRSAIASRLNALTAFSVYEQASAYPLPQTATPVLTTDSQTLLWLFGAQFGIFT